MGETIAKRMIREVVTLSPDDTLRSAVELEIARKIRHFPVVDAGGKLLGIVTDRDLKRALPSPLTAMDIDERERMLDDTKISRVMTKDGMVLAGGVLRASSGVALFGAD